MTPQQPIELGAKTDKVEVLWVIIEIMIRNPRRSTRIFFLVTYIEGGVMNYLRTSESVTCGHPDKICDLISDTILDAYLSQDPDSRVACEVVASKGEVYVTGEITSNGEVDIERIVRDVLQSIGYSDANTGIDYRTCDVRINISKQSPDIGMGVDLDGAGDQGMIFGYACRETDEYMPLAISLSHQLASKLESVRRDGTIPYLGPDGKVQVTVEYEDGKVVRIDNIVLSTQHAEGISMDQLKKDIISNVIEKVVPKKWLKNTKYLINPTGRFVIGGPLGDSGLTGRKIIVDTYGGYAHHGGGAFSGKDATKVDRSAAYMARFVAKNIVANGYADRCEIGISYAIGVAEPVSIMIDTFGTGKITDEEILMKIRNTFDLTPKGIIETLDLRKPIFHKTTNYGHFGKSFLPWEQIIEL